MRKGGEGNSNSDFYAPHQPHATNLFRPRLLDPVITYWLQTKWKPNCTPFLFKPERCTKGIEFGEGVVSFDLKLQCSAVLEMK